VDYKIQVLQYDMRENEDGVVGKVIVVVDKGGNEIDLEYTHNCAAGVVEATAVVETAL